MNTDKRKLVVFICVYLCSSVVPFLPASEKALGYRGIWFTLGQKSEYGDKYSGGLGTYTANHIPIAIYAPAVKKTFFVYGGTTAADQRHLLIMASYYDHEKNLVPRPTIVFDKKGVNDPHDNAALSIDADGYLWIFISGRARARAGLLFKSAKPYDIDDFHEIARREMTYPQPRFFPGHGFVYLFTKYTAGRELYWQTSPDGLTWQPEQKLVGLGGHYQVSGQTPDGSIIGTAFMWHPNGNVDARTNLYYLQTRDCGKTWTALVPTPSPLVGEGGGEGEKRTRIETSVLKEDPARRPRETDADNSAPPTPHPSLSTSRYAGSPRWRSQGERELTPPLADPHNHAPHRLPIPRPQRLHPRPRLRRPEPSRHPLPHQPRRRARPKVRSAHLAHHPLDRPSLGNPRHLHLRPRLRHRLPLHRSP